jgi:hypothetical protein
MGECVIEWVREPERGEWHLSKYSLNAVPLNKQVLREAASTIPSCPPYITIYRSVYSFLNMKIHSSGLPKQVSNKGTIYWHKRKQGNALLFSM